MKKVLIRVISLLLVLAFLPLASCGGNQESTTEQSNNTTTEITSVTEYTAPTNSTTQITEITESTTIATEASTITTETAATQTTVEIITTEETKITEATTVPTRIDMTTASDYTHPTESTLATPEVTTTVITTEVTTTEVTTEITTERTTVITTTEQTTTQIIVPVNTGFDESKITLSLGMMSDIHVNASKSTNPSRGEYLDGQSKFKAALEQLKALASLHDSNGIDAICIAGDLADSGSIADLTAVKNVYESVFDPSKIPMVAIPGNHDNAKIFLNDYFDVLGNVYFQRDVENSLTRGGYRHVVINGLHILLLDPYSYGASGSINCPYTNDTKAWLDRTLNEITTSNPNQYVFVLTHPMVQNTCYGSGTNIGTDAPLGGFWYTNDLTSILSKYPQVVTFGGHLHFPINDERSIMQTAFTSIGCGSVRYMANEAGNFINSLSSTTVEDCGKVSSGYLIQIDTYGNIRITRMNFTANSTYKTPWELVAPKDGKVDLTVYSSARSNKNAPPRMLASSVTVDSSTTSTGAGRYIVNFNAGSDDDLIHHYIITLKDKNTGLVIREMRLMTDFYLHSQPSEMKKNYSVNLGDITTNGTYIVAVVAEDSWGARSNEVIYAFEVTNNATLSSDLPNPYVDLSFANGTVSDNCGKVSLVSVSATVGKTSLAFAGKTKTIDALTVSQDGKNALVRFNGMNQTAMTSFYNDNDGFSFEALYVNRAPNSSQGVFCGTQQGGLGLAQDGDYPYFYIYTDTSSLKLVSSQKASTNELTHIIVSIIYDSVTKETRATMYLNGNAVASSSVTGKLRVVPSDTLCGLLALGADIDKNGTATDFKMTDFSIVSAKIYDSELNYLQAGKAFEKAKTLFD
ncbi:MAG: metallophosphoesterase [Clostridia bacterium]|nr:metallophosphoesterase [Clostridia bacterium]